jgi:hypothetical protein
MKIGCVEFERGSVCQPELVVGALSSSASGAHPEVWRVMLIG